jgi:hypothetical protein
LEYSICAKDGTNALVCVLIGESMNCQVLVQRKGKCNKAKYIASSAAVYMCWEHHLMW